MATSDQDGCLKIWDLRSFQCVFEVHEQEDGITGIALDKPREKLLTSSTDGTLAVFDLKSKDPLYALSDNMEEELTGVEIIKEGKYVTTSTQEGNLYIFKWDWFGDCKDRIPIHKSGIEKLVKYNEDHVLTGGEDGFLRAFSFYPNQIAANFGAHADDLDEAYPILGVGVSHCRKFAATVSHDSSVKFFDLISFAKKTSSFVHSVESEEQLTDPSCHKRRDLENVMEEEEEEMEVEEEEKMQMKAEKGKKKGKKGVDLDVEKMKKRNFFEDL